MPDKILFLTLRVFSATGGIEKVCMAAGKALYELSEEDIHKGIKIFSLYDESDDVNTIYIALTSFFYSSK